MSKIENEKLDFGDYPSEVLICRLADALEADVDELLLLAKKIPEPIRRRVFERPEVYRRLLGAMTRRSTVYWRISVVMDRSPAKFVEKPAEPRGNQARCGGG